MKKGLSKKSKILMICSIIGLVLIVGILAIVNAMRPPVEVIVQTEAITVETGDVKEQLDVTGTVKSMNSKVFFSPVNAQVAELNFETGDSVERGEKLIVFDLKDLEENNERAELQVQSGHLDYNDAINQNNKNINKQAQAQANANKLQNAVNQWQAHVDNLKYAINQANVDAQNAAIDAANYAAAMAESVRQGIMAEMQQLEIAYQNSLVAYNNAEMKLKIAEKEYDDAINKGLDDIYDKQNAYIAAQNEKNNAELARVQAEEAYNNARDEYYSVGNNVDTTGNVMADTYNLQAELESASAYLGELKGELASEKAKAESDIGGLTAETKAKMEIGTNLTELEAKSIEELIEEGKKGIQAEFTGVISSVMTKRGSTVAQGMELFTLESTEDVSIDIRVSKNDYAKLKEGQKAAITLAGNEYEGTVIKVDRIAMPDEKGNTTIGAKVHIDNPDANIFLGVEAKAIIKVAEATSVLVVPSEVINIGKDGAFCYVIEDGIVVKRTVETGVASTTSVEIITGLKAGEQVIVDIGVLVEGDKVAAIESEAQETANDDMTLSNE